MENSFNLLMLLVLLQSCSVASALDLLRESFLQVLSLFQDLVECAMDASSDSQLQAVGSCQTNLLPIPQQWGVCMGPLVHQW